MIIVAPGTLALFTLAGVGGQVGPAAPAQAQSRKPDFEFTELIASLPGYSMAVGMTGSVSAADFDADGDIDLYLPTRFGTRNKLIINQNGQGYVEGALALGLGSMANDRASLWFDYDGDGRLDLLVASDFYDPDDVLGLPHPPSTLRLYRQNESGTFDDVTTAAGLFLDLIDDPVMHIGGMVAGDLSGNGYLDVVFTMWKHQDFNPNGMNILHNQGDGTFTRTLGDSQKSYWQPVIHDFDGDGRQDIYVAVDYKKNVFALNTPGGFVESAPLFGIANAMNDMGVTLGDYDNDQDIDIFVTNIFYDDNPFQNVLFEYDHVVGDFTERAGEAGVENTGWGWGTTWMDADLDGNLDLAVTNGRQENPNYFNDTSRFFLSRGDDPVTFKDVSWEVGFDDKLLGACLISLDFDRDGDLDLAQTCVNGPMRLLGNNLLGDAKTRHYLCVQPRMSGPNSRAIGAVVRATVGDLTMTRLIHAGTSMMGQEPAEAFFGLKGHATVDTLTIEWPGGGSTTLNDVPADQILVVDAP